jgi:hypothetical protein
VIICTNIIYNSQPYIEDDLYPLGRRSNCCDAVQVEFCHERRLSNRRQNFTSGRARLLEDADGDWTLRELLDEARPDRMRKLEQREHGKNNVQGSPGI